MRAGNVHAGGEVRLVTKRMPLFLSALVMVGGLTSCNREKHTVDEVSAPRFGGVIDLRIGGPDDSDKAYLFTDVRGLALDSTGRVFVADNQSSEVRVFSPTGRYQFTIGRPGRGPGDLLSPCCLAIAADGRLWVEEPPNLRYSVFEVGATSARLRSTVRMPSQASGRLDRVSWDSSGHVLHSSTAFLPPTQQFRLVRSRLDAAGDELGRDTVPDPPAESLAVAQVTRVSGGGRMRTVGATSVAQPFGPSSLRAFGPGGERALAVSSRYAILWLDISNRPITIVQREVKAPQVSHRERSDAETMLEQLARNLGVARSAIPFAIPRRKTPITDLGFDLDGRLWVERSVAEGEPREADVFDRSGRWVSTMVWPADVRLNLWTVQGHSALGVAVDGFGAQRIVRLHFQ
jgi:hypothetical protein